MTSNFIKICQLGAELFHVDRQTDRHADGHTNMMKLIVTFHSFANEPKN